MENHFREVIEREVPAGSVLISVGLPGSWKSPVTEEIGKIKNFPILRSDMIRVEVLEGEDVFDEKIASDPSRRKRVYDEMFRRTETCLRADRRGIILDATFVTQDLRSRAAELALKADRAFVIAECLCSEKKSIERILKRTRENYESNALTREAYLNNKALFQPVDAGELKKKFGHLSIIHLTIDTEFNDVTDWKILQIEKR